MSAHHQQHDNKGARRVREELGKLKKLKAPWYFESQLQQRIRFAGQHGVKGPFLFRPLPAYALSLVALVSLGIIGYYTLFQSWPAEEAVPEAPLEQVPPAQPPAIVRERPLPPAQQAPAVVIDVPEGGRPGPSAPKSEPTVEARIPEEPRQDTNLRILENLRPVGVSSAPSLPFEYVDSVRSPEAHSDTVDTLTRSDSLRHEERPKELNGDESEPDE